MLTAKSIIDDKMIELPFHEVFWKLVLGFEVCGKDFIDLDIEIGGFYK